MAESPREYIPEQGSNPELTYPSLHSLYYTVCPPGVNNTLVLIQKVLIILLEQIKHAPINQ